MFNSSRNLFLDYIFIYESNSYKPKDQSEFEILSDLLKKLDIVSVPMEEENLEDLGLSKMPLTVDKTKKLSQEPYLPTRQ